SILLFDGFDEISPSYDNKVSQLLRTLKDTRTRTGVDMLWVTTRANVKQELENKLDVFSYTLEPLSERDQKEFLVKFWKANFIYNMIKRLIIEVNSKANPRETKDLAKSISKVIKLQATESGDESEIVHGDLKQIEESISTFV